MGPSSLNEFYSHFPVWFIREGNCQIHWIMVVLQLKPLQYLYHQQVKLHLCKPPPDTQSRTVSKWNMSKRMRLMMKRVPS